jgi:hypothetical protein
LSARHAKALIVGKMQVQDVHFHRCHSVNVALERVRGNKVAANVDGESAPGEARRVFDVHGGGDEAAGRDFDKLEECL